MRGIDGENVRLRRPGINRYLQSEQTKTIQASQLPLCPESREFAKVSASKHPF